ncbi:MAG: RNA polymerase sigma factor, partial [Phycisphaerales bacterium]|nr:RNA polymerase sigma factor [Phycisphaerales bacterium]
AARGDESAWREVVARYARRVFALARSRVRSPELAEEVTQAVFAKVATTLGSGGYAEVGRFESWLFRIAMNRVRDEARRSSRHATPTDPATLAGLGPAAGVEASQNGAGIDARALGALRGALGELPDADREVIELRHHGQMSFKAMADLLGEPLGTLLARHHRALRKLRAIIEASTSGVDADGFGRSSESTSKGARP